MRQKEEELNAPQCLHNCTLFHFARVMCEPNGGQPLADIILLVSKSVLDKRNVDSSFVRAECPDLVSELGKESFHRLRGGTRWRSMRCYHPRRPWRWNGTNLTERKGARYRYKVATKKSRLESQI